jgi:hypothetical protein
LAVRFALASLAARVDAVAPEAIPEPVGRLDTSRSVNHPLVTLEPEEAIDPVRVKLLAPKARFPPETVNPPVAVATVISAEPLKDTPPMFLAVWRVVAVVALPERAPEKVVAVTVPEALIFPEISKASVGATTPIPTLF